MVRPGSWAISTMDPSRNRCGGSRSRMRSWLSCLPAGTTWFSRTDGGASTPGTAGTRRWPRPSWPCGRADGCRSARSGCSPTRTAAASICLARSKTPMFTSACPTRSGSASTRSSRTSTASGRTASRPEPRPRMSPFGSSGESNGMNLTMSLRRARSDEAISIPGPGDRFAALAMTWHPAPFRILNYRSFVLVSDFEFRTSNFTRRALYFEFSTDGKT